MRRLAEWLLSRCPRRAYLQAHDPRIECAPGEVFLRCSECGRRTGGWQVPRKDLRFSGRPVRARIRVEVWEPGRVPAWAHALARIIEEVESRDGRVH